MPQSTSSSAAKSKPDAAVVKHRACDECRTRKLACSKELDGCGRCRKEGWKCVYSPQKPMGRPRKRRLVDESDDQQASAPAELVPHQLAGHASSSSSSSPSPSQLQFTTLATPGNPLDMDYSAYYDTGDYGNMAPLDMPFYDFSSANGLPQAYLVPEYADLSMGYVEPAFPASGLQFGGVDLLGGINFDEQDSANTQLSEDINKTAQDILALNAQFENRKAREAIPQQQQQQREEEEEEEEESINLLSESSPNLSPPQPANNNTPSTASSSAASSSAASSSVGPSQPATPASSNSANLKPLPETSCTCLSQVYLALDTLTRLPQDIIEAMKVARGAARVAHDLIECPKCAQPIELDVTTPPTMQSFQNTMLLGTLLPTIANAYVKILEMIETTVSEAKEKDEDIVFRLSEYGGYWGNMAFLDKITCHTMDNYGNKVMKPEHWRLTVRALLRLDVYGYEVDRPSVINMAHISHRHLGLRDIIQAMEERSTRRHDLMDALVASGQPHPFSSGQFSLMQCDKNKKTDKEERHCLKIVEMARNALDKLVIA